jgi:hypothetical protein
MFNLRNHFQVKNLKPVKLWLLVFLHFAMYHLSPYAGFSENGWYCREQIELIFANYNFHIDARGKGCDSMDVIIGRYRACMEEEGLLLKHESGIQFDLETDETLELLNFINLYRKALLNKMDTERPSERRIKQLVFIENERRIKVFKAQEE